MYGGCSLCGITEVCTCLDGKSSAPSSVAPPMSSCGSFRTAEDYRDHLPCKSCEPVSWEAWNKVKRAQTIDAALDEVRTELSNAMAKFPPFNSAHEGFGVIAEEFNKELWEHVCAKQGARSIDAMRKEAIQVAAMAVRFMIDICNPDRGQK